MLFNLFSKSPEPNTPKEIITDETKLDALYIDIKYDLNNNLVITADYDDKADTNIVSMALYMLNTGQLLSAILESLLKNSDSYTKQMVLQKILKSCNNLMNQNDNSAIIRPSEVFIKHNEKS